MRLLSRLAIGLTFFVGSVSATLAGEVSVAVAANFTAVAEELAVAFKARTGDELKLSFGASGALYTQITQGAPFEVLLSADTTRPELAIDEGFGVAGSSFIYAVGKLVLYSPTLDVTVGDDVLKGGAFEHIAIADPATAPYGAAAVATLKALGLTDALADKLVTGGNISQALQFVQTGNAELGFVALSQVIGETGIYQWQVPAGLYAPIEQGAVLLKTGEGNPSASAFLDYLKSDEAIVIIEKAGYSVK